MIVIEIYLPIVILIFILFFITISIFGSIFFSISNRKKSNPNPNSSSILIYFGVGTSIYLFYSMIIVAFQIFNFLTSYLPFILIDLIYLFYIIKKKKKKKLFKLSLNLKKFKVLLSKYFYDFLIIIVAILASFTFHYYFISPHLGFLANDPYFWFKNLWIVHEEGYIDYSQYYVETYPPGYILFSAGALSITDNYYIIYCFCKYLSVFLSVINIIILFQISKRYFKKKIDTFFTLMIYLSFSYIGFRYNMFLPSNLATTLGFLFLYMFLFKKTLTNLEAKALIMGGIFLTHHLYGLFYFGFYFFYQIYIFLRETLSENSISNKKSHFLDFFKRSLYFFLIIFILLLPFLISASIYLKYPAIEYYFNFFKPILTLLDIYYFFELLSNFFIYFADFFINFTNFFNINIISNSFNSINLNYLYFDTIKSGIYLIIIGIFIPFNKVFNYERNEKKLIVFIKVTFLLSVFTFLLTFIFTNYINVDILSRTIEFISHYSRRFIELFGGYWALIFVLSFRFIIKSVNKIVLKIKLFRKNNFRFSKIHKKILSLSTISAILFLSFFFYTTNYRTIRTYYYFQDSHIDVILYTGNYFNENPINKDETIIIQKINYGYNLLYDDYNLLFYENLNEIYLNFSLIKNYLDFKIYINQVKANYVLINLKFQSDEFKSNFTTDFIIIYQNNEEWIFANYIAP